MSTSPFANLFGGQKPAEEIPETGEIEKAPAFEADAAPPEEIHKGSDTPIVPEMAGFAGFGNQTENFEVEEEQSPEPSSSVEGPPPLPQTAPATHVPTPENSTSPIMAEDEDFEIKGDLPPPPKSEVAPLKEETPFRNPFENGGEDEVFILDTPATPPASKAPEPNPLFGLRTEEETQGTKIPEKLPAPPEQIHVPELRNPFLQERQEETLKTTVEQSESPRETSAALAEEPTPALGQETPTAEIKSREISAQPTLESKGISETPPVPPAELPVTAPTEEAPFPTKEKVEEPAPNPVKDSPEPKAPEVEQAPVVPVVPVVPIAPATPPVPEAKEFAPEKTPAAPEFIKEEKDQGHLQIATKVAVGITQNPAYTLLSEKEIGLKAWNIAAELLRLHQEEN